MQHIVSLSGGTASAVAADRVLTRYGPENTIAPCSFKLKVEPFRKFIEQLPKPITVHLGMDFTEQHRMISPKAKYEEIEGITVDFPLMWEPVAMPPHRKATESWGIETPILYRLGFPHNNCGGRCVKQGIKEWQRLKQTLTSGLKKSLVGSKPREKRVDQERTSQL